MSQIASRRVPFETITMPNSDDGTAAPVNNPNVKSIELVQIYQPIQADLAIVEAILQSEIQTETPWVDRLLKHNWIGGGKRIRPVFLLLSGAAAAPDRALNSGHHQLSAAIEMIHAATLVHDDVLDNAETRRHLPTVNATWDNRTSVLLGDFLFTHAFHVAALAGDANAIRILAKSSNKVCEGEIRQNASVGNFELCEQEYLAIIADKTGELCACSCRLGALMSGAETDLSDGFARYGHNLGVAFQIIDDVLDLVGQQNRVGKTLGTDLLNQKPTLPIIHCLKNAAAEKKIELIELLQSKTATVETVLPLLHETKSVVYARSVAQDHAHQAVRFAESLPASPYATGLQQLAQFVLARMH